MTESQKEPAVGIDLGTTYSVVAHLDSDGRPWTILNSEGDMTTPSVVYFDQAEAVVGKEAVKVAEYEPEKIAQFVKRDMGNSVFHKTICGQELPPEAIQSIILKKLKEDAELKLGSFTKAVVTVPAYFNEPRRKATQDAAKLAGLDILDIINEPTAAAISFGVQQGFLDQQGNGKNRETILVYDLGGGTFDVTLMEIDGRNFDAIGTAGDVYLGGIDWDRRIADHIAEEFKKEHDVDPREDDCAFEMILHEAEDAKRTLSTREEVKIHFAHDGMRLRITLTRKKFEELTGDLIDRTLFTINKLLRESKRSWSDITRLLLVGGSSRMPMIQTMLEAEFGLSVDRSLSPDEAVAHGAAIYAGILLNGDEGDDQFSLTNVNSHDLGVLGIERSTGLNRRQVMLSRNTQLPATSTQEFTTYEDNQKNVVVNVIEGGDASGKNSTPIGKCIVTDLPEGLPAKTPVEVSFHYAANGRLTVDAKLPSVNRDASLAIERASGLSKQKFTEWAGKISQGVSSATLESTSEESTESPSEESDDEGPPDAGPDLSSRPGSLPTTETKVTESSTPSQPQSSVPEKPNFVRKHSEQPSQSPQTAVLASQPETQPISSRQVEVPDSSAVMFSEYEPDDSTEELREYADSFKQPVAASEQESPVETAKETEDTEDAAEDAVVEQTEESVIEQPALEEPEEVSTATAEAESDSIKETVVSSEAATSDTDKDLAEQAAAEQAAAEQAAAEQAAAEQAAAEQAAAEQAAAEQAAAEQAAAEQAAAEQAAAEQAAAEQAAAEQAAAEQAAAEQAAAEQAAAEQAAAEQAAAEQAAAATTMVSDSVTEDSEQTILSQPAKEVSETPVPEDDQTIISEPVSEEAEASNEQEVNTDSPEEASNNSDGDQEQTIIANSEEELSAEESDSSSATETAEASTENDEEQTPAETSKPEKPAKAISARALTFSEVNSQADEISLSRQRRRTAGALGLTTLMHALILLALAMVILPEQPDDAFALINSEMTETEQEQVEQELEVEQDPAETLNFQAGSVSTTAVGGSNSSVVTQQKLDQSTTLRDPNVQVNLSTQDLPGLEIIGQDLGEGEVTGEIGAVVSGYGQALDQITQELIRMLRTHELLVVWLFDESGSMKDDQEDIKKRIGTVYEELKLNVVDKATLGKMRKKSGEHLLSAITSFGGEVHIQTSKPTADVPTLMQNIEEIPVDTTGAENMCQAIIAAAAKYSYYRRSQNRKVVFIVVSDESGDDGHLVEEALLAAVSLKAPIYFMGREAVFGSLYAHIRWVQPSTGRVFLLPIRRGPETPYAEQLQFDGYHKREDAQMSGFGPYEQVRLARKTGGIFFQLPREEQNLNGLALFEAKEKMLENREYVPDNSSRRRYAEQRSRSPFRQAIWDVIKILNPYDKNAKYLYVETRGHFVRDPAGAMPEVEKRLNQITGVLNLLGQAQKHLDNVAPLRRQEASVRWRANFDLIQAQIFAYRVRLFEYGIGLAQFSLKTPGLFKDPKSNRWRIDHGQKDLILPNEAQAKSLKVTGEELIAYRDKALEGFKRVQKEHPNTPWFMRAEWELKRAFGVKFTEAFHDPKVRGPGRPRGPAPPPPPKL